MLHKEKKENYDQKILNTHSSLVISPDTVSSECITGLRFFYIMWLIFSECHTDPRFPCLKNKQEVLASYDFHESNLWSNIMKIVGMYLLFHIGAYLGLLRKVRAKKMKS